MEREIKRDCVFYNWGGDPSLGYPCYPREYGARCECHSTFFQETGKPGRVEPDCVKCHYFCDRAYVLREG